MESHFTCPITFEPAYEPVVDIHGHLFDRPAIVRWLLTSDVCPINRENIRTIDLRPVLSIAAIMPPRPVPPPPVMSEEYPGSDDEMPELILAPIMPEVIREIDRIQLVLTDSDTEDEEEPEFVFGLENNYRRNAVATPTRVFRMIHPSTVNLRSSNCELLNSIALYNARFVARFNLLGKLVHYSKYIFRTVGSVQDAIRNAAINGYYVYDMFSISPGIFVLYSCHVKFNRSINRLPPYQ